MPPTKEGVSELLLIWNEIFVDGGFNTDLFFIDCKTEVHDFKDMFSKEKIQGMIAHFKTRKTEIEKKLQNQQEFWGTFLEKKNKEMADSIQQRIDTIYLMHEKIIQESNFRHKTSYSTNAVKLLGHLSEWIVKEANCGMFGLSTCEKFHFYIKN